MNPENLIRGQGVDALRHTRALEAVQHLGNGLAIGETGREVCPRCRGGSSGERSLSLKRTSSTVLHYTCFRANCDLGQGVAHLDIRDGRLIKRMLGKEPVKVQQQLQSFRLSTKQYNMLRRTFRLPPEMILYAQIASLRDGRYIFPLFNEKRARIGNSIRLYPAQYKGRKDIKTLPKSMNNMHSTTRSPCMSWYFKGRGVRRSSPTLVIVEDIISALRLNEDTDAVSLQGVQLGPDKIAVIRRMGYERIYLCLDKDASQTALAHIKKSRVTLPNLKIKFLDKDIKDMSKDAYAEFIGGIV